MDTEKRKAKIQMEKEKIQAAKADAKAKSKKKKKEPTTPVARAGTPPRGKAAAESADAAVGAPEPEPEPEPGSVAPAAVVAAKRKASIAKEAAKRKKALQEQRAAKKRAATPERKADDSKPKASAAAERKAALQKERQKRAEAAAVSDGAAADTPSQPGGKANGTKAKADPVTPTARPADAAPKPTVTSVAGTSRKATSVAKSTKPTKSKKESKADAIAAKKEEIKRKRALKAKGAGAASDAEPGKADEEPPPLPPGEQRARPQPAKAKSAQGKRKKAPATPRQEPAPEPAPDAAPLDPADILRRLHAAADGGDEAALATAVAQATKAGVDLNAPDPTRDDCTAVYLAAQRGHHRLVERLAQNGADLMLPGAMDATPLFIASYHGFDRVVGVIADNLPTNKVWRAVRSHRAPPARPARPSCPALQPRLSPGSLLAPSAGREVDGREIVRPGDVFKPDTKKADRAGLYEGVLLGSDQQWPRTGDEWAKLPGDLFESVTEREIQLEKRVDDSSPFFIACQEGNKAVVQVLFEAGVDIEAPDGQGATPFYSACQQGQLDVVRFLFGKENPRSGEILDPERGITVNGVM